MKHGAGISKHPLYRIWAAMKSRCSNPKSTGWKNYGGRGIKVCKRWADSFLSFLEDVGENPGYDADNMKLSIDRINNDGDYEPGNVRWANYRVQSLNRRPLGPRPDVALRFATARIEKKKGTLGKAVESLVAKAKSK